MVGDLERAPGGRLGDDLLRRQGFDRQHALAASRSGQPHQRPILGGIDRRAHVEGRGARNHVLGRRIGGVAGNARIVAHGVVVAREVEVGDARRAFAVDPEQAMPGRRHGVGGHAEGRAHHARAGIEQQADLLLDVLVVRRQRHAVVGAEHRDAVCQFGVGVWLGSRRLPSQGAGRQHEAGKPYHQQSVRGPPGLPALGCAGVGHGAYYQFLNGNETLASLYPIAQ